MEMNLDPVGQKLIQALTLFRKLDWNDRTIDGCKPSEIRVLFCIQRAAKAETGEIKVSEISQRLRVTSPTVTQILNTLEARGLIDRTVDQEDRRSVDIRLTPKGTEVTRKAWEGLNKFITGLVEHLGREDSSRLADLLLKTFQYYESRLSKDEWRESEEA